MSDNEVGCKWENPTTEETVVQKEVQRTGGEPHQSSGDIPFWK